MDYLNGLLANMKV